MDAAKCNFKMKESVLESLKFYFDFFSNFWGRKYLLVDNLVTPKRAHHNISYLGGKVFFWRQIKFSKRITAPPNATLR